MSRRLNRGFAARMTVIALGFAPLTGCGGGDGASPQPTIVLSAATATLEHPTWGVAPEPVVIQVTNGAGGELEELAVQVTYTNDGGWLLADLGGLLAPTTLTLSPAPPDDFRIAGTYEATVSVSSPDASNSPRTVAVTFYDDLFPGIPGQLPTPSNHGENYLLGSRITVPVAGTLTHAGLFAEEAGPLVKIGIYTDVAGEPGQLIASTAGTALTVGRMELPVTSVTIGAGDYWFMAVYGQPASVAYEQTDAPAHLVKYVGHTYANALPTTFPTPTTYDGQIFSYYLRVRVP